MIRGKSLSMCSNKSSETRHQASKSIPKGTSKQKCKARYTQKIFKVTVQKCKGDQTIPLSTKFVLLVPTMTGYKQIVLSYIIRQASKQPLKISYTLSRVDNRENSSVVLVSSTRRRSQYHEFFSVVKYLNIFSNKQMNFQI